MTAKDFQNALKEGKTEVIQYDTRNGKHYSYTIIKAGPKQITLFSPILKRNIKKRPPYLNFKLK